MIGRPKPLPPILSLSKDTLHIAFIAVLIVTAIHIIAQVAVGLHASATGVLP